MNLQMNLSKENDPHSGAAITVISGLILILTIGFLDVLLGLLKSPGQFVSFFRGATALALTMTATLFLYSSAWFLIAHPISGLFKLNRQASSISLAAFIGTMFLFGFLNDFELERSANSILQFVLVAAFCSSIAVLSYVSFNTRKYMPRFRKAAAVFLIAGPVLLAEVLFVLLLRRVATGYSSFFIMAAFGITLIVLFTATIWIFYRYSDRNKSMLFLSLLLLISLLSPLTVFLSSSNSDLSSGKKFKAAERLIRNVILVTIDTLRADALRLYSDEGVATPNIEALAKDATLYRNAYSEAPWTLPSVTSLMTGVSPLVHLTVTPKSKIPSALPTMAEHMHKAGFYTGAIGANVYLEEPSFARGFIDYEFMPVGYYEKIPAQSFGLRILKWMENRQKSDDSTAEVTKMANEWIVKNKDKDFFLWIHYFDPHQP
ncbi:MAG: sulfatase-like hydrolase/transferase, partial [Acidobacteriota bacterium]